MRWAGPLRMGYTWCPALSPGHFHGQLKLLIEQDRRQHAQSRRKGRPEPASSSIRYVGAKEPTVPLPLVLIVLALLVLAIVAVRHYVQA